MPSIMVIAIFNVALWPERVAKLVRPRIQWRQRDVLHVETPPACQCSTAWRHAFCILSILDLAS